MPKGPLRRSIEDMASTFGSEPGQETWWEKLKKRDKELHALTVRASTVDTLGTRGWTTTHPFAGILYVVTGNQSYLDELRKIADKKAPLDLSGQLATWLEKVFSNPIASEIAETIGAAIATPILTTLTKSIEKVDEDPLEPARSFTGMIATLSASGALADGIAEAASVGQIDTVVVNENDLLNSTEPIPHQV